MGRWQREALTEGLERNGPSTMLRMVPLPTAFAAGRIEYQSANSNTGVSISFFNAWT